MEDLVADVRVAVLVDLLTGVCDGDQDEHVRQGLHILIRTDMVDEPDDALRDKTVSDRLEDIIVMPDTSDKIRVVLHEMFPVMCEEQQQ